MTTRFILPIARILGNRYKWFQLHCSWHWRTRSHYSVENSSRSDSEDVIVNGPCDCAYFESSNAWMFMFTIFRSNFSTRLPLFLLFFVSTFRCQSVLLWWHCSNNSAHLESCGYYTLTIGFAVWCLGGLVYPTLFCLVFVDDVPFEYTG